MQAPDVATQRNGPAGGAAAPSEAGAPDAAAPGAALPLAADLLTVWLHLMRDAGPQLFAMVEDLNLGLSHVKALHVLEAANDDASVKDLAQGLGLSLPATSRLVDCLVRRGFAGRREDELDRRIKRVSITQDGRALLNRINAARLAGLEQFVAGLDPAERDALHAALSPIAARLNEER